MADTFLTKVPPEILDEILDKVWYPKPRDP